ncbi:hypothetical protein L6452_14253 [Arctium lappa]|uniref:Uncharacterized protein n=1 Tax=Arctium lappa TaxID=4217 RepID=A0ACB9CKD8_ARCLA|nr:hypothetical protein L6452_14253 [Arctium lappa]
MGIYCNSIFLLFSTALFFLLSSSTSVDTISANHTIKDGNTIVSHGGTFELGFFSLRNSKKNRYLGIWYKKISVGTVVWVANRRHQSLIHPASIKLVETEPDGSHYGNTVIWPSNSMISDRNLNPVAQLLETGNLVVWDRSSTEKSLVWKRFDYFGDTFMPRMKFGKDLERGRERSSTSWKSPDDPSPV